MNRMKIPVFTDVYGTEQPNAHQQYGERQSLEDICSREDKPSSEFHTIGSTILKQKNRASQETKKGSKGRGV